MSDETRATSIRLGEDFVWSEIRPSYDLAARAIGLPTRALLHLAFDASSMIYSQRNPLTLKARRNPNDDGDDTLADFKGTPAGVSRHRPTTYVGATEPVACSVINRMTELGMLISQRVGKNSVERLLVCP